MGGGACCVRPFGFCLDGADTHCRFLHIDFCSYTDLKRQLDLAVINPATANILALSALESDLTKKLDIMLFWWTKANANLTALVLFFAIVSTLLTCQKAVVLISMIVIA